MDNPDRRIVALLLANIVVIVGAVFQAGIMYQRVAALEIRVVTIESRKSQDDAIASMQAQIGSMQGEISRARDRLDRAIDLGRGK